MSTNQQQNPFFFLQPYGLKERYALKGRENEARALLSLLKWKDLIVIFGKSGVGKTSFINHTLSMRINRVNWLPIRVTRLLDINESLNQSIDSALNAASIKDIHEDNFVKRKVPHLSIISEEESGPEGPVEVIRKLSLRWNRPVYLIIDQLEELFLIAKKEEQEEFLRTLQQLMEASDIQKKVILVLREEHLGYIQEIEKILSGVFQDALAVRGISKQDGPAIYDSLLNPINEENNESLADFRNILGETGVGQELIDACYTGEIFDAQKMQVLLFLLWERFYDQDSPCTNEALSTYAKELCNSSDPLKNYLESAVNIDLAHQAKLLKAPYWFILRNAISPANTKMPISVSELYKLMVDELISANKTPASTVYSPFDDNQRGVKNENAEELFPFQLNKEKVTYWCEALKKKKILQELPVGSQAETYYQLRHDSIVEAIHELDKNKIPLKFARKVSKQEQQINPYQGLNPYDRDEGINGNIKLRSRRRKVTNDNIPRLYGREAVVKEYLDFLTVEKKKCLVVVGDSGTGKSSLVKGGLLPALQLAGFETKSIQPGPDLDKCQLEISKFIEESSNSSAVNKQSCLYIDQFEECYTFRESRREDVIKFESFLQYLDEEISKPNNNFKLVLSIRHDYAHEFDRNISKWREYKKLLRYPDQNEIFDIIVGPAFDKGVRFEPEDLPERIAADAANTSYFLPLLSFVMRTLYEKDVENNLLRLPVNEMPVLTAEGYGSIGGIVRCLQEQFTKTYKELTVEEKQVFPQLMARMIVIKDVIPKAQPLAVSRINYPEPGKTNNALTILDRFTSRYFFRTREIRMEGKVQTCYEPIHDSLLKYCDEIRSVMNRLEDSQSQMHLQPIVESAVKEWKRPAIQDINSSGNFSDKTDKESLFDVIQKRYKDLDPLYNLVDEKADKSLNWLFTDELELISEGKQYADQFRDSDKLANKKRVQELEFEKQQQQLREEKLEAEHARALAEKQRKEHQLMVEKLQAENLASEAQQKLAKRKRMVYFLSGLLLFLFLSAMIWYRKDSAEKKQDDLIRRQREILIDTMKVASQKLDNLNSQLLVEKDKINEKNNDLIAADSIKEGLIKRLTLNGMALNNAVRNLEGIRKQLVAEGKAKDLAIEQRDSANKDLSDLNRSYLTALNQVDSLKNIRIITLAELNKKSSPALSFRLTELSSKEKGASLLAENIRKSSLDKPQYFESLIVNNVVYHSVSRDGSRIITVEEDPATLQNTNIRIWNTNGKQLGEIIRSADKIIVADFSADNKKVMLASENMIRINDLSSGSQVNSNPIPNLLYAKFSESNDQLFAITNNKIIVWQINGEKLEKSKEFVFMNEGVINNASMFGDHLVAITPNGIWHLDISKRKKISLTGLPQSFIVNNQQEVLAMDKPRFGSFRRLNFYSNQMINQWMVKVPDKAFNLITSFASSPDGKYGIIRFNQKENIVQYTQQQQQQQQQQQISNKMPVATGAGLTNDNFYFIDLGNGSMTRINNDLLAGGSFVLSSNKDSVFEFGTGSILRIPLKGYTRRIGSQISISENTRFKQVSVTGEGKDLILSLDANNQLKLWRFGAVRELDKNQQLWNISEAGLKKIISPE
jgi:energy-coupling factor transporter ATP-binding protein EcfA2